MESSAPPRRIQITDRDQALLAFVAEQRIVLATHVQTLLGVSARVAAGRLSALTSAGLLDSERLFQRRPRCWWIARAGLQVIGSELPPSRLDVRGFRHDIGLAWLWLGAQQGVFGPVHEVVSERQMRSSDGVEAHAARAEGRRARQFAVRLGGHGAGGRERLHYPDLLLVTDGGRRIAVELELSTKTRTRRERILAAYGAEPRLDAVLYLVDKPSVARAVQSSAARLGISPRVHVQRVVWSGGERIDGGQRERQATRQGARAGLER